MSLHEVIYQWSGFFIPLSLLAIVLSIWFFYQAFRIAFLTQRPASKPSISKPSRPAVKKATSAVPSQKPQTPAVQSDLFTHLPDDGVADRSKTPEPSPVDAKKQSTSALMGNVPRESDRVKTDYGVSKQARTEVRRQEDKKKVDSSTTIMVQQPGERSPDNAILRATRMEEMGLHRSVPAEDYQNSAKSVSADEKAELLASLGLPGSEGGTKSETVRMKTQELQDIMGKLDAAISQSSFKDDDAAVDPTRRKTDTTDEPTKEAPSGDTTRIKEVGTDTAVDLSSVEAKDPKKPEVPTWAKGDAFDKPAG
jgi:hypothetical protein